MTEDVGVWSMAHNALARARKTHPFFANNVESALSLLIEEVGEVAKEINEKNENWEKRLDEELLDVIAVCLRIIIRDYSRGRDHERGENKETPAGRKFYERFNWYD